ncbi:MAG TPA: right-handed parallel beta-helix repeat-containing protein, partial [Methylomirabilota bacterium]|nr:right-handed parallel beta-helix repeat-containing protein [Methylomirabilota bacterium]
MYHVRSFLMSLLSFAVSNGWMVSASSAQGLFTVNIGGAPAPSETLVAHGDTWHYHKGTNSPQANWQTLLDASLDGSWATGPGGFGYGDGDDATVLNDMRTRYSTVYIRRSFESPEALDAARRLELVMDWDDGFIAWLDGIEVARSPNAPGAVGEEPPFSATTGGRNHEASAGVGGNPPMVFDLGAADVMLPPGPHVLAIMGFNDELTSSDLSLIADLRLTGGTGGVSEGRFFALVTTNQIRLFGSNTLAGAVRVVVNGDDAAFNPVDGTWSKLQPLRPGWNSLFVAALDAAGDILAATNRDVVAELETVRIGGTITNRVAIDRAGIVVRLTDSVTTSEGGSLALGGVVVLLGPGQSIRAEAGGEVVVRDSLVLPADGTTAWERLAANGTGASLVIEDSEVVAGQLRVTAGAVLRVEDSVVREMYARQMIEGLYGNQLILRNSHFLNYAQTHIDYTPTRVEGCLFENITSDAMDFEGAPAEIRIYRTTWRRGFGGNTDAIDLGNNQGVIIDECLIHGFPDKAVSVADQAHGNTVRNTVIHHCGTGLNVYASSNNVFLNTTIYGCSNSLQLYERTAGQGAGFAVASNLIVWANSNSVSLANGAALELTYSDVQDGGFPGEGNLSADPLFANPSAGDFT